MVLCAMGVMLSPPSLEILGSIVGETGFLFPVILCGGALVHRTLSSFLKGRGDTSRPTLETQSLLARLGPHLTATLLLGSRPAFALFGSALILAVAGHAFNEVFPSRLPGPVVPLVLLGLIALCNIVSPMLSRRIQVCSGATVIACLTALSVAALLHPSPPFAGDILPFEPWDRLRHVFLGAVLFVGYDLFFFGPAQPYSAYPYRLLHRSVTTAAVLFLLWGFAAFLQVTPVRSASGAVPYFTAARIVWGETGRILLGTAILAGSVAAVNLLISSASSMLVHLSRAGMLPSWFDPAHRRPTRVLLLLVSATGALLASGVAEQPVTEAFARCALYFWLLLYGASRVVHWNRERNKPFLPPRPLPSAWKYATNAVFAAAVVLTVTDPDPVSVLGFALGMVVLGKGVSLSSDRTGIEAQKQAKPSPAGKRP